MEKKKITWWKIALGIVLFPFVVMYFMFKYLYKFYRSDKFTRKQKAIYTVAGFAVICIIGAVSAMTRGPVLENVVINDLTLYKDETKDLEISLTPKDADIKAITFNDFDSNIISIDDKKIKGFKEGQTEVVCKITDSHSNEIKSNKFIVTVSLTDKQIAEANAKAADEAAKAEQKLQEKRNTISTTESITIKDYCKDIINSLLKAPSTAEYPGTFLNPLNDWQMAKTNNLVTVKSYVDAQNSFGAMMRSEFIIQVQMQDDGSGKATYVQFDGKVISGSYQ